MISHRNKLRPSILSTTIATREKRDPSALDRSTDQSREDIFSQIRQVLSESSRASLRNGEINEKQKHVRE